MTGVIGTTVENTTVENTTVENSTVQGGNGGNGGGNPVLFGVASSTGGVAIRSDDGGLNWTLAAVPTVGLWSLCYSPDLALWVAVGTNLVYYSSDLVTWTAATTVPAGSWREVIWASGLGLFVMALPGSFTDVVATSPDGDTWTQQTTPQPGSGARAPAWDPFNNALFVGGQSTTTGIRSTDGVNWNSVSLGLGTSPTILTVNSTTMIGLGLGGRQNHSEDGGANWSQTTLFSATFLGGAASENVHLFVGSSACRTSVDGSAYPTSPIPAAIWESVAYDPDNDRFVALNRSGGGSVIAVTDDDGVSWNSISTPAGADSPTWREIAYGKVPS